MEQIPFHSINTMVSTSATGCPLSYMPDDDDDDSSCLQENRSIVTTLLPHNPHNENQAHQEPSVSKKVYPMNFFTRKGTVHTDRDELIQRWMYRKDCPTEIPGSVSESTPFLSNVLVQEMVAMRDNLSKYALGVYTKAIRETANSLGLTLPTCHQSICLNNDLKAAISALTRTAENELLVYKVFHHRMRTDKSWHISIVDDWASSQNIQLLTVHGVYQKRHRPASMDRQGFGNICLEARKKVIQKYMRELTNKCGWKISTTNKEKQATKRSQVYTERVMVDMASPNQTKYRYYVVESSKAVSCKSKTSPFLSTHSRLTTSASLHL